VKSIKQNAIQAIRSLPDNTSYEDIMEKLYFLEKIDAGLKDIDSGNTLTHDEVKERLAKWLK
jgi:predicted transcriptional regulator